MSYNTNKVKSIYDMQRSLKYDISGISDMLNDLETSDSVYITVSNGTYSIDTLVLKDDSLFEHVKCYLKETLYTSQEKEKAVSAKIESIEKFLESLDKE